MEFSTRQPIIDFDKLINYDLRYVLQYVDSRFITDNNLEGLDKLCKEHVGVTVSSDLIEDAEVLLNPDELKVLIYVSDKMYHVLFDTIPLIIKLHRMNPDIRFVLYVKADPGYLRENIFQSAMIDVLKAIGAKYFISYVRPSRAHSSIYRIANFICIDHLVINFHEALSLVDVENAVTVLKDIYLEKKPNVVATRKVYLTRPKGNPRLGLEEVYAEDGSYTDDTRIYKEEKLKDFFSSKGFEIVTPEEKFKSLKEQIEYMSEVSVLAAVSASGLSNSIFMNDNGTVIEILAEVVTPRYVDPQNRVVTNQTLPSEYFPLSFMRGHTHIMISSFRDPDKVIRELDKGIIYCL